MTLLAELCIRLVLSQLEEPAQEIWSSDKTVTLWARCESIFELLEEKICIVHVVLPELVHDKDSTAVWEKWRQWFGGVFGIESEELDMDLLPQDSS